jgi:glycine/D-amino acid oxidase-like deaminating enzyme
MAGVMSALPARDRFYDADVYAFGERPDHYWARSTRGPVVETEILTRDVSVDVAIIGAGYAGLGAALRCVENAGLSVGVFDAGAGIGWGASGRNGGFVSTGGVKLDAHQFLKRVGEDETRRYYRSQTEAVSDLRNFISENQIDCEPVGDGNVCVAHSSRAAEGLRDETETLRKLGVDVSFLAAERFRAEFHHGPETFGALLQKPGFAMQPFALVQGMARVAIAKGVQIWTGTRIAAWQPVSGGHRLITDRGVSVSARYLIMATNGYTPNMLAPRLGFRVVPAISNIIVTQAYNDRELEARGFNSLTPLYNARDLLFYYRRLPDGRLLFGSRGDTDGSADAAKQQTQYTLDSLKRVLPAFDDASVAYSWRGLVALTARRSMAVGLHPVDKTIAFAFGCHGSGTATMQWAGRLAADLLTKRAGYSDVPVAFRGLPPPLPQSTRVIRWGLKTAYRYYGWRDAVQS